MNKTEAKKCVRKQLRSLPDVAVRNLMEHAANKTPLIIDYRIRANWVDEGAG